MSTPTVMIPNTFCHIPEEVLTRQSIIDNIPTMTIMAILLVITGITIFLWYTWSKEQKNLTGNTKTSKLLLGAMIVILCPLWYQVSVMSVNVFTSILNPEYAALEKFTKNC